MSNRRTPVLASLRPARLHLDYRLGAGQPNAPNPGEGSPVKRSLPARLRLGWWSIVIGTALLCLSQLRVTFAVAQDCVSCIPRMMSW